MEAGSAGSVPDCSLVQNKASLPAPKSGFLSHLSWKEVGIFSERSLMAITQGHPPRDRFSYGNIGLLCLHHPPTLSRLQPGLRGYSRKIFKTQTLLQKCFGGSEMPQWCLLPSLMTWVLYLDPHSGRRELTPTKRPLTFYMPHTYTYTK